MKAVIMAGGVGSRLLPLTASKPKPMVKITGIPVLGYAVDALIDSGITDIDITLRYMPNIIIDYLEKMKFCADIKWHIEKTPLGTAGGVFDAVKGTKETIIVISGDAIFDFKLHEIIEHHKQQGCIATMAVKRVENPTEFGVVVYQDDRIIRFIEKPNWEEVCSNDVNTGIYVFESSVLKYDTKKRPLDFSKDIFPAILKDKKDIGIYRLEDRFWCDIGSPEDYLKTNIYYIQKYGSISKDLQLKAGARVIMPSIICPGVQVGENSVIGPNAYIGENSRIDDDCRVKSSIVLDDSRIKSGCIVSQSVLCEKTRIDENSIINENTVLGENVHIESNCHIGRKCRIWPGSLVAMHSIIEDNSILDFSADSISAIHNGRLGDGVTLPQCIILGRILGTIAEQNGYVAVCSIKNSAYKAAIVSGLLDSGTNYCDYSFLPGYLFRNEINKNNYSFGVYIDQSDGCNITILNSKGGNVSSLIARKISNYQKRCMEGVKIANPEDDIIVRYVKFPVKNYIADIDKLYDKKSAAVIFDDSSRELGKLLKFSTINTIEMSGTRLEKYDLIIVLKNSGMNYHFIYDGKIIGENQLLALGKSTYSNDYDPFVKGLYLIKNMDKQSKQKKAVTAKDICRCPQSMKGEVMKELYSRYGSIVKVSDNGINMLYGKSQLHIAPHEYAPVIEVSSNAPDLQIADVDKQKFINEIEHDILKKS